MDRPSFQKAAQLLLRQRNYRQLQALCQSMRAADPAYAEAWFLESVVAEAGRNPGAALRLIAQAIELSPDNPEYWTQKARYHAQVNQVGQASDCANRALALGVSAPAQLDTLGVVLTRAGDYGAAAKALRRAVKGREDHPQYQFNLAAAEQFLGNDDRARQHFERVIALQPEHARSYWALSELEKNDVDDRHEAAMRQLAAKPDISDRDGLYLAHALARIEENRGHYGAAIELLAQAKARRREHFDYSFEKDRALFAGLRGAFDSAADVAPVSAPVDSALPVPLFIVGLPRTGTTLVERILSSHPQVASLGELQELPQAIKRLSGVAGPEVLSPEVIAQSCGRDMDLARSYLDAVKPRLDALAQPPRHFIDKTPHNFFYLGYIARLMPRARMVLLRRDPLDAGLSNYRQLFALDYSYYNYSYDLQDTGRYCAAFEKLADHWESLLGPRLSSLRYEHLVADPEPLIRAVLDYVELPWDDACLNFHRNAAAVATPSASQVRQPLYRDAIGRWRRYGDALKPLQDALIAEGVAVAQL